MTNKIINFTNKFLLIFTIICFSIALIGATFFYVNRSYKYLNPILLIIGSILYIILIHKIYKFIINISDEKKKKISILLIILQFILLLISSFIISSTPKVDLIHILTEINSLNNTNQILNSNYFSVYPNNRFLVILLYSIQKISPDNNHLIFCIISSLSITITSLFAYKSVKKIFDINKGLLCLFIFTFCPIFYLYVSYFYTDILMMPFTSILFYLMIKSKDENKLNKSIVYSILIGMLAVIGYKIRAVVIFILVAYFVYLILTKNKNIIKIFIPIIISFLLTLTIINKIDNHFFPNINPNKEFPVTHWVMMGLNKQTDGYYSQKDYLFSSSAKNVEERKKLNINEINKRLNKLGPIGTAKLLTNKIISVWSKGDYSYQKYLTLVQSYNSSYRFFMEDENILINYLLQFSKITTLLLCITSLIKILRKNDKSILAISLFGSFIFYLLWEACPRYSLSFLPWMIMLGSYSYDYLNIEFENFKYYKYFKYIIIILTLFLLALYFPKYTNVKEMHTLIAQDTANKIKLIDLNKNKEITEKLKINNNFNEINLKFKTNNDDSNYTLELLNENNKILYKKTFNEKNIKNEKYTSFKLDKTYQKGNYIIKLSTKENSSLKVYTSYKKQYDYFNEGILTINNKNEEGDLMFEIYNVEKRGIFSKLGYILITIIIVFIEYILLFRKKDKENEKK